MYEEYNEREYPDIFIALVHFVNNGIQIYSYAQEAIKHMFSIHT